MISPIIVNTSGRGAIPHWWYTPRIDISIRTSEILVATVKSG